ncbi:MAG: cellulase family glycosylhydrolase [Fuerstiella sp.]|nr:cellulase family glycosylhydrolase [Fuerstiella sp.]
MLSGVTSLSGGELVPDQLSSDDTQNVPIQSVHRAQIPDQVYAPYVDTTLWPLFDIVSTAQQQNVKHFTLAFVVAEPGTNEPSWGGYYDVSSNFRGDEIAAIRAMGGEVMVSFGGAAGTELAVAIPDVNQLTAAYQSVIDQYQLTWIDFDIEGMWVRDQSSIDRRSASIRDLQAAAAAEGRPLEVWFTLPVLPSGLTPDGAYVIESALRYGVDIGGVNIMAMDYGDGAAPNPEGQMGAYAIQAAESLFVQMQTAYLNAGIQRTEQELWTQIGVTPMLGQNDVMSERFYIEDAQQLLQFATEKGVGLLSAWSVNRDNPSEIPGTLEWTASGVPQEPFEFSQTFFPFTTPPGIGITIDDVTVVEGSSAGGEMSFLHTSGNQILDAASQPVQITGVSWFGMETDTFAPHGLWARNWKSMMDQMRDTGFNTIRLPYSNQMLDTGSVPNGIDFSLNPDLQGLSGLEILDQIIAYAEQIQMRVILDHHRSDAGAGPNGNGLWYTDGYSEERWIADWVMLAARYQETPAVVGADLHNEPHSTAEWGTGNTATDWRLAAERAGNAVLATNPNWLIIVEGIQNFSDGSSYWWGGNLSEAGESPVRLNQPDRLVYSPHAYPESVFAQEWFNASGYPENLPEIWDQTWGYLYQQNTAPILLGEFGSRLESVSDQQWMQVMVSYLGGDLNNDGIGDLSAGDLGMSWTWWSWNPNSSDTGGILEDDWQTVRQDKLNLLAPIQFSFPDLQNSPSTIVDVVIRLSSAASEPVTVNYKTTDGTATGVDDYTPVEGVLLFEPGEVAKVVRLQVTDDTVQESNEEFFLNLSDSAGADLRNDRATIRILDDDGPNPQPLPIVSITDAAVTEGNNGLTPVSFVVSLSQPAFADVTFEYETVDGTATAGTDYQAAAGQIIIAAGETDSVITVNILGDTQQETDEHFLIRLTGPENAIPGSSEAVATIKDNDQPDVPAGVEYVTTSDWGSGFNGEMTLTNLSSQAWTEWTIEFDWDRSLTQIWSGVIVSEQDGRYLIRNESWNSSVSPGQSVSFGFGGNPGNVTAPPQNILVNGVASEEQLPTPEPIPELLVSDVDMFEGDTGNATAEFVVTLAAASGTDITLNYRTLDGTATAGIDYQSVSGQLTIPAGGISGVVVVPVLGDGNPENDETFYVEFSSETDEAIATAIGTATLRNDDFSAGDLFEYVTVTDWGSGFTGEVTLTNNGNATWDSWTVEFEWGRQITQVWSGTLMANAGDRYTIRNAGWNGSVAPGQTVSFGFNGTFGNVTTPPQNVTINGTPVGDGIVIPAPVELSVGSATVTESTEHGQVLNFPVTLSRPLTSAEEVTVVYATASESATAGEDFESVEGQLTFAAGQIAAGIQVPILDDDIIEGEETFRLVLEEITGAVPVAAEAQGIILDNDVVAASPSVDWQVTSQWSTGFVAQVVVTNPESEVWEDWVLEFDSEAEITRIWGAEIIERTGTRYRIRPAAWNQQISQGGSVTLGYQVSANTLAEPTNIVLTPYLQSPG